VLAGSALFVAACSQPGMKNSPSPLAPSAAATSATRAVDLNNFEICKDYSGVVGPAVLFNIAIDVGNNGSVDINKTQMLSNGQCAEIHTTQSLSADKVTVTEVVPTGYTVSWKKTQQAGANVTTTNGTGATAFGFTIHIDGGALIEFTNTADPVVIGEGRFTGGGNIELANGTKVSNGLTLHCDLLLSNNLNVVWKDASGDEHHFHLEEHLTTIACTDAPNISQPPPDAPLDTMIGRGIGRYNNTDGYTVEFTLVDGGEGSNAIDRIALKIFQTRTPSNVVLQFALQDLIKGNLQAHFDQPHK
jgi:hypothetical protein